MYIWARMFSLAKLLFILAAFLGIMMSRTLYLRRGVGAGKKRFMAYAKKFFQLAHCFIGWFRFA
jgi:hypothetical protein